MNPLFKAYPELRERLPWMPLGKLPTPVERMEGLEASLDTASSGATLYVKRDDLSGDPYGGNKVRKLEFLLGDAQRLGKREVLTFGAAGSNHALATALYARQAGLRTVSMLIPQPNAGYVRRNLLLSFRAGAELHHCRTMSTTVCASLFQYARQTLRAGLPYVIMPGGTSSVGAIGFVSAAFELREQIEAGEAETPDMLHVASGTMGTAIGLLLGLSAAGLATHVHAVRVTDPQFTSMPKARRLFRKTNALLHSLDGNFPMLPFPEERFEFRHEFFGEEYARYTKEGVAAVRRAQSCEGLELEGTYTGKTLAAVLADADSGRLDGKTALFWNTHNSWDFTQEIEGIDYHGLPKAFHRYFEEPVQALD